ncbi:hypothetical protein FQR65_LT14560 [Abscondita terminalis]|nr:hypothetical protein FQR65_LT14560 [Abscondita terminalis]
MKKISDFFSRSRVNAENKRKTDEISPVNPEAVPPAKQAKVTSLNPPVPENDPVFNDSEPSSSQDTASQAKANTSTSTSWPSCWTFFFKMVNLVARDSAGHKLAIQITEESSKEVLENVVYKVVKKEEETTERIFRTAYKVAKKNQAFNDFEAEIDVQKLNGLDMGRILHSRNACANIVNYISSEMQKILIKKIVDSQNKVSLIFDEATTFQKSVLILYIRTSIDSLNLENPVKFFLTLIELDGATAVEIFDSLMSFLLSVGLNKEFLSYYLISVTSDGASVMLGCRAGVAVLLKAQFPNIIIWWCLNHRLELSVGDAVKAVASINRMTSFLDKLYTVYHASPKNARQLKECAKMLELQLLKIGRVLSVRWVASSFRTVSAIWEDYEALVLHFQLRKSTGNDTEKATRSTFEGLHRKITSVEFVLDLGLMCDALQELSELSLDLQKKDIDLYTAHVKIECLIDVFERRGEIPGPYYEKALEAAKTLKFQGIELHKKNRASDPPISPASFYQHLKTSIESRLLSEEDVKLVKCTEVLNPKKWPPVGSKDRILYGEKEIQTLSKTLQLSERESTRALRLQLKMPDNALSPELQKIERTVKTVAISSAEAERGFSQMNLIVTPDRSSLSVVTTSALLFIRIVGPPLAKFDPAPYVKSWLLKGRHSAVDTQSKVRKPPEEDPDMVKIWTLF